MATPLVYLSPSRQKNNIGFGDYGSELMRCNEICDLMEPHLNRLGITYYRNPDPLSTLRTRTDEAAQMGAAYYLAIHTNAGGGSGYTGYVYKTGGRGAAPRPEPKLKTTTGGIAKVIAVASGKGGVGKSTVTANLAVALRNMGFRVGILDADIYGPSQPKMFGVEGYLPDAVQEEGADHIVPAEPMDIRLMSIGFFIKPTDALLWRGAMAVSALKQMIHQTKWGTLDFLLADLPPGTGDVHLSIIGELKIDSAVIVSTPQQVAVADVVRGVEMFRNENVNIPVAGIIENMAWFTPAELPENRYYIFGRGGARAFAERSGVDFLGEIPIVQSIMEGGEEGRPAAGIDPRVEEYYREIAEKVVSKVMKNG